MIDFDRDTALAKQLLDVLSVRSKAALHNIANQNVPGFKRYEVRFEEALRDAAARGGDLAAVQPEVVRDTSGPPGQNNVSLLDEMALLDKSRLLHEVITRRAGSYFTTLNRAIFGR
jgi:flagellar basal-body rod protein FlgB